MYVYGVVKLARPPVLKARCIISVEVTAFKMILCWAQHMFHQPVKVKVIDVGAVVAEYTRTITVFIMGCSQHLFNKETNKQRNMSCEIHLGMEVVCQGRYGHDWD